MGWNKSEGVANITITITVETTAEENGQLYPIEQGFFGRRSAPTQRSRTALKTGYRRHMFQSSEKEAKDSVPRWREYPNTSQYPQTGNPY